MRMRPQKFTGFTLVELLVVIGIIAVLMSILLPSLSKARQAANTIKCASNLRSIGQGMQIYLNTNGGWFPPAYAYRDQGVNPAITSGNNWDANKTWGYFHWSSYIMGSVSADAFKCPALPDGGLPATNPKDSDIAPGQTSDISGPGTGPMFNMDLSNASYTATVLAPFKRADGAYADDQAPRMAYAVNEALCCRPKYNTNVVNDSKDNILHATRHVNVSEVANLSGTILASEYAANWQLVSGAGASTTVCKSHRPISPWRVAGTGAGDADKSASSVCDLPSYGTKDKAFNARRANASDLWVGSAGQTYDLLADIDNGTYDPAGTTRMSRLDQVGRNHPASDSKTPRDYKTNFLYADGHVESKNILDTIPAKAGDAGPWEWGAKFYSLPDAHVIPTASEPG